MDPALNPLETAHHTLSMLCLTTAPRGAFRANAREEYDALLSVPVPSRGIRLMSSATETTRDRSKELFARAVNLMPGGVNSPVRAFRAVGGSPRFIKSASGATITDVDGRTYIDYVGSWGPMILGHADAEVVAALQKAATDGTSFGAPTELEVELAQEVV